MPLPSLYDPADLAATPLGWDELARTSVVLRERRLRRKDGSTFIAELSVRRTAEGLAQAIVRDVTERKRAEAALRAERDLLDGILATSVAGILVVNPAGRVLFLNSRAEAVLGITRDQLADRVPISRRDGGFAPRAARSLPEARGPRGGSWPPASRCRMPGSCWSGPTGSTPFSRSTRRRSATWTRTITAVVLSISDITEQHCAQQALLEREEQLHRVTSAVPGVVYQYVVGPGDGRALCLRERAGPRSARGAAGRDLRRPGAGLEPDACRRSARRCPRAFDRASENAGPLELRFPGARARRADSLAPGHRDRGPAHRSRTGWSGTA